MKLSNLKLVINFGRSINKRTYAILAKPAGCVKTDNVVGKNPTKSSSCIKQQPLFFTLIHNTVYVNLHKIHNSPRLWSSKKQSSYDKERFYNYVFGGLITISLVTIFYLLRKADKDDFDVVKHK